MDELVEIADAQAIERFCRRDPYLHLYELGDLDERSWPATRWYGIRGPDGVLGALCLLWQASSPPTLVANARDDGAAPLAALLGAAARGGRLPSRLNAHLSPGAARALAPAYRVDGHGAFLRMRLDERERLAGESDAGVERLGPAHAVELAAFYSRAYPDNWFDARTLESGHCLGIREAGRLVCAAGVHVHAPAQRVAALGNIATDPACRGRGLARRATAALCRALLADGMDTIGLNVRADNAPAIACYRGLGFTTAAEYEEAYLERRG